MSRPLRLGVLAVLAAAVGLGGAGCEKKKLTQGKGGWTAKVVPVSPERRQDARRRVEALWAGPEVQAELQAYHPGQADLNFYRDLVVLTRHPHRLAGYGKAKFERIGGEEVKVFEDRPGSLAAGQYVADRLRAMGVEVVLEQDFPVVQPLVVECELEVEGRKYGPADGFHVMRPNHLQASVTPAEGLTGPTVYAGTGRLDEYTGSPQDAIVVMEFDSEQRWLRAFAMGAKAVVFIGTDRPVANPWHHVNFPANLPRFYVSAELAERLKLRANRPRVTIRAATRWKVLEGRNVIGIIRGTRPRFDEGADEALVLAAPLDSLSEVPALSPGARAAANCAALLSVAEYLLAHRPRRDVVLCFLDGETLNHAGARAFYGAVLRSRARDAKTTLQERLGSFLGVYDAKTGKEISKGEVDYITGIQQILRKGNIFLDDWRAYLESAEGLSDRQLRAQEGRIRDSQRSARAWMRKEARALADDLVRNDLQLCRLRKRQHLVGARALRKRLARAAAATRPAGAPRSDLSAKLIEHDRQIIRLGEKVLRLRVDDAAWSHLERMLHKRAYPDPRAMQQGSEARRLQEVVDKINREVEDFKVHQVDKLNEEIRRLGGRPEPFEPEKHKLTLPSLVEKVAEKYRICLAEVQRLCRLRQQELTRAVKYARQGLTLVEAIGEQRNLIVLHLALNLSDGSSRWTFIHGQDSQAVHASKDALGRYSKVFHAIAEVARAAGVKGFEARAVGDPFSNRMFAPGKVAHSGCVAGTFGTPNLALMTPMDRRERDGQPCDLLSRRGPDGRRTAVLNVPNMLAALAEIRPFLKHLADAEAMSLASDIKETAMYVEASFSYSGGAAKYKGGSVLMISPGSVMPDRPARGAMVAVVRKGGRLWEGARVADFPAGFRPFSITYADVNGHIELPPYSGSYIRNCLVVAALFDDRGLINYITSTRTVSGTTPLTSYQGNIFPAVSCTLVGFGFDRLSFNTQALKASSTAPLNEDRSLVVESGNVLTVYAKRGTDRVKVFNSEGMVILGNDPPADPVVGRGVPIDPYKHYPTVTTTAANLHTLNGGRLTILRDNRILEHSIERLHLGASDLADKARKIRPYQALKRLGLALCKRLGLTASAAAYDRCAYAPLHQVLNDLVVAVVLLLLLAIPFAYSIERLLVGSPHIYRQIGWFVVFFLVTFAVLYMVNPAFRIAATPIVIFLAFGIILLSTIVIVIMTRKLESEVRRLQGLGSTVHSSDVSRLSTMMAAVHMGISTMRRRPIRTLLTAVTVVLLTFTILTFASFTSGWGNRKTYTGPMSGPPRLMVRHPFWTRIHEEVFEVLDGFLRGEAEVVPRYWVAQSASEVEAYKSANRVKKILVADGAGRRIVSIRALVGLDPRDIEHLPKLREVIGPGWERLKADGVFLTAAVAGPDGLNVKPGETVYVDGVKCVLAGVVDTRAISTYTQLESSSFLPVDYEASSGKSTGAFTAAETQLLQDLPEVESAQFVTFGASRVGIVSAELARRLGGRICSINVYPVEQADIKQMAERVATITRLPTYCGAGGSVQRLFFTSLTEASGWRDLIIPVVLGGLIIFATMLGSVSDREKEIYAFSALGLAPPHVAGLFFAEACVYAVVGGMGGYLLGQVVSRALNLVAEMQWFGTFSPPTMNYSSTNAIVTVLAVMCTVLISTIYPAVKASRSANPGIQRSWKIGKPKGDMYDLVFPFTVSAYDITGVVSFLEEHFRNFSDTALGVFATSSVHIFKQSDGQLGMEAQVALAPFDLGVSQRFALMSQPSEIEGIQEIRILLRRLSGTRGDWQRANRVFVHELRKQLLIWRSLSPEIMERYRQNTLTRFDRLPVEDLRPETFGER